MGLFEVLLIILVIAWLSGWGFAIGGSFIHLLLVVAIILFLCKYVFRIGRF